MPTIEELINQYRTELPDYLLRRQMMEPNRTPATLEKPTEEIKTVVEKTEPQVDPALRRLQERRTAEEAALLAKGEAAQKAQEEYRKKIMERGMGASPGAPSPFGYSQATLAALDQAEKEALKVAGEPPKKEEGEGGWQQAAVALLPAIIGGFAGRASGIAGGTAAGIGAGGQASAESLKAMGEAQSEKFKRQTEQYVKRLDVAKEVFRRKVEIMTAPELQEMKAASYFAMNAAAEKAKQAVQKGELQNLSQQEIKMMPEVQAFIRAQENLKELDKKIADVAAKTGTKQFKKEVETGPKLDKEKGLRPITPAHAERVGGYNSAEEHLVSLIDRINSSAKTMGPIAGRVGVINPYNKEARALAAEFGMLTSAIAKEMERGRVSDKDIERFKTQGPQITDDPQVAVKKAQQFLDNIRRDRKNFLNSLETGKFDVSAYKTQQPGAAAPAAAAPAEKPQQVIQNGVVYKLNPKTGQYE